jgi:hypothetical protein
VLSRMVSQRDHGKLAWDELRKRWSEAIARFPDNTIGRMVESVKTLTLPEERADVAAFFSEHEIPQAAKALQQTLDRQTINVVLRERATESLARTFA